MHKTVIFFAILATVACQEARKRRVEDPLAALDKHISHTLAYHYLWPWSQLFRAAAALDAESFLEEPKILSDDKRMEIRMSVKQFQPDELRIKVKNRYIIVEGKRKGPSDDMHFMANHFVQRFVLPPGSKQEEVKAVLNENSILSVSVPKHDLPPPPPEIEVPIEVKLKPKKEENKPETEEKIEVTTEKKETPSVEISSQTPLEQLELVEATTHVGKIRKKELKTSSKPTKDNEVTKGVDTNGLDYALVEQEE